MSTTLSSGRAYVNIPALKVSRPKLRFKPFGRTRALPPGVYYETQSRFQIDFLMNILKIAERGRARELRRVAELARKIEQDASESDQDLSTDMWLAEESDALTKQLVAIGLLRVVELMTRRILAYVYGRENTKLKRVYRREGLRGLLSGDFGVSLEEIKNYARVDELRCLSNSIKHDGMVEETLARFRGWRLGKPITVSTQTLQRLASAIPGYLRDLTERVNLFLSDRLPPSTELTPEVLELLGPDPATP